ncbi:hypothetical protein GGR56DRAFT_656360 [Xylariaceae sp. FL0804]|nr:hypothetical protein GGR56DRAFT_656360 [Xylariaceae sp. FL0804]
MAATAQLRGQHGSGASYAELVRLFDMVDDNIDEPDALTETDTQALSQPLHLIGVRNGVIYDYYLFPGGSFTLLHAAREQVPERNMRKPPTSSKSSWASFAKGLFYMACYAWKNFQWLVTSILILVLYQIKAWWPVLMELWGYLAGSQPSGSPSPAVSNCCCQLMDCGSRCLGSK